MSIQDIIDWLASRINNLYDNIYSVNPVNTISERVTELENKNTELETKIIELENIISQMQNK